MKTILFTNARNEDNIIEWVTHHLLLGFSKIFIIDHKSTHPIYPKLQKNNIEMSRICVFRMNNDNIIKTDLIMYALKYSLKYNYDWLLYLDCDEFLVLNADDNITSFLTKYRQYDQVGINWLLFGSNYRDKRLKPEESIIHTYTRSAKQLDQHIKSCIHLRKAKYFNYRIRVNNPHYFIINNRDYTSSVNVNYKKYDRQIPYSIQTELSYTTVPAFIAHYYSQSYENYITRKILLPKDDDGLYRTKIEQDAFHKMYNHIINEHVSMKYPFSTNTNDCSSNIEKKD
jgi:hypothetical protein